MSLETDLDRRFYLPVLFNFQYLDTSTGEGDQDVLRQEAVSSGDVVDTTGAGDCFTAAYAAAVLQGSDQQAAMRYASTAAGFCVCHKGAMPSLPWSKDLEQLL